MSVTSGSSSYVTGTEFLKYYDRNLVAELLTTSATPVADPANDGTLAEFLAAASGRVEAACLVGAKYTATDLGDIASSNAGHYLKQLVSSIAMQLIRNRKGRVNEELLAQMKQTDSELTRLRNGELIFGILAQQEANWTHLRSETPAARILRTNSIGNRARRYFGDRGLTGDC